MTIKYGNVDDMYWQGDAAHFKMIEDGKTIDCRVSREAIKDLFGDPSDESACLDAAKENFEAISDKALHLIKQKRFETDGSLCVYFDDL